MITAQQVNIKKSRGFSLIELAVALIVVGVLAAIAVPTFQQTVTNADEQAELQTVTAAMRNIASVAATHDRVVPNLDDAVTAVETENLGTVIGPGGTPAPTGRTFVYTDTDGVVTLATASQARSDACVVGVVAERRGSATFAQQVGGDCGSAVGVEVAGEYITNPTPPGPAVPDGPSDPDPGGGGTDCSLIPPSPGPGGTFVVPAPWVAGSVSGCVPTNFVDSTMGFMDPAMVCPAFSTGSGSWVRGVGDIELPFGFGNAITLDAVNQGVGCEPGTEDLGWASVPYSHCPSSDIGSGFQVSNLTAAPWIELIDYINGDSCVEFGSASGPPGAYQHVAHDLAGLCASAGGLSTSAPYVGFRATNTATEESFWLANLGAGGSSTDLTEWAWLWVHVNAVQLGDPALDGPNVPAGAYTVTADVPCEGGGTDTFTASLTVDAS